MKEMQYHALPAETKKILNSISTFQQPFDAIALFEDVWGAPSY
ncbi:hypothetical protein [Moritella sp.]|nr:hypothetical protein [Moritella sp.]